MAAAMATRLPTRKPPRLSTMVGTALSSRRARSLTRACPTDAGVGMTNGGTEKMRTMRSHRTMSATITASGNRSRRISKAPGVGRDDFPRAIGSARLGPGEGATHGGGVSPELRGVLHRGVAGGQIDGELFQHAAGP